MARDDLYFDFFPFSVLFFFKSYWFHHIIHSFMLGLLTLTHYTIVIKFMYKPVRFVDEQLYQVDNN